MAVAPAARCLAVAQQLRGPLTRAFLSSSSSSNMTTPSPAAMAASSAAAAAGAGAGAAAANRSATQDGLTLDALPKSWHFTASLPPDPLFPTPADSHKAPRDDLGPRQVRGALFTWVRPESQQDPDLLAVSPAAMRDLGLAQSEADTDEFRAVAAGNKIVGWDADTLSGPGYPWAQCYGGFQFGDWAGQLGDGRAISLFEATNPRTGVRYEVQLKGAGMTPYSRFADGKAVLRSSIREFVVSEALHALGIPTTRALALTLLPHSKVRRERIEPGAIVVRFAQSWLRFGNFDILRARGDRDLVRRLATYLAEDVFGGWETLPARLDDPSDPFKTPDPARGVPKDEIQGPDDAAENRFARLYREIVRRNALTVAKWQVYGFMNGVLNTDNTSLFGLSMDYGPFAFMDTFDPSYTPNHDDHLLRYSYRNQPTIIWWNLVRLGEALAELLGAGPTVDTEAFLTTPITEATAEPLATLAEKLIMQAAEEYKSVFLGEYKRLFRLRLGLRTADQTDFDKLFSPLLDTLEALELDYNLFFRRLSSLPLSSLSTPAARLDATSVFFPQPDNSSSSSSTTTVPSDASRTRLADWLALWRARILHDWAPSTSSSTTTTTSDSTTTPNTDPPDLPPTIDTQRTTTMKLSNPSFLPRSYILDDLIRRVEHSNDRAMLRRVLHMALHPFEDSWSGREFPNYDGSGGTFVYEGDPEEEQKWTGDVPRAGRGMQCSCSS
ncbi:hypothetical protein C8A05DRAFT_43729 [Staphylotrichum tortipilum]|uniref:Selenoprotein O n=1 Tax=Staphylotrichum tortipilum TaxID=2831512 RepID=A0AAN6MME8_9PEZI|nr:hypothetical protein C8A05DRAFT_43729 [Staphylotrichum longicolle]